MAFSKLANSSGIPENEGIIVNAPDGTEIALFKYLGKIFALENSCPHQGAPLGEGLIEEGCVICPWHGWQFDMATGSCKNRPGADARSFSIEVIDDEIFLKN